MFKTKILLVAIFIIGLFASSIFAAESEGAEAIIKKYIEENISAYKNKDAHKVAKHILDKSNIYGFDLDGSSLVNGFNETELQNAFNSGVQVDLASKDIEVHVYGDGKFAVATGYLTGRIGLSPQTSNSGTWRMTMVWTKNNAGEWKSFHWHISPLVAKSQFLGDMFNGQIG